MAKLNQAQEQTMEEILASIRRMISDDEARAAQPKAPESRADPAGPPANVSRLFAKPEAKPLPGGSADGGVPEQTPPAREASNVIEIALDHAMDETAAEAEPSDEDEGPVVPVLTAGALPTSSQQEQARTQPSDERRVGPLLSPHSDAAVASAFDQLASTMLSGSIRTIDELVEDLLRPMLRNWLDTNLPPLVERLVREEIERVSRGRR